MFFVLFLYIFFFQAEDGIRDGTVTGVQTCALPIWAPWARLLRVSGTMSDSSYSSTAPNPLHPGHAPRGLLKENRMGVSAGAGVAQCEHVGCSEKRRRSPVSSATDPRSPSLNALAAASASRPRCHSE